MSYIGTGRPHSGDPAIVTPVPQQNGNTENGEDDDGMDEEYIL